jgi:hypothetical protein
LPFITFSSWLQLWTLPPWRKCWQQLRLRACEKRRLKREGVKAPPGIGATVRADAENAVGNGESGIAVEIVATGATVAQIAVIEDDTIAVRTAGDETEAEAGIVTSGEAPIAEAQTGTVDGGGTTAEAAAQTAVAGPATGLGRSHLRSIVKSLSDSARSTT